VRERLAACLSHVSAVVALMTVCGAAYAHEHEGEGLEYQWTSAIYRKEILFQSRIMLVALVVLITAGLVSRLVKRRRTA
jgi:hypothetical protein